MATKKSDLETLKQALADARAILPGALKALLYAQRLANTARRNVNEAMRAYSAARNPKAKRWPRPARAVASKEDSVFSEETEEVA